jgi:transposase
MEQALKLIVRHRKNAYFYKTPAGAAISDVITSLIATAMQAGINVFDYFNAIQRHSQLVKDQPEKWLQWNYDQ